jgi:hypothetical protein
MPTEGQEICYTWVSSHHQRRFGGDCMPPQLRQLADLGYLRRGDLAQGGSRRYYSLVDPQRVSQLLGEWGML